jgi:hypothetical protein
LQWFYLKITVKKPKHSKMKRALLALFAGILMVACGPQEGSQEEAAAEDYLIAGIVSNPMELDGQLVSFEGTIGHICRNSGDKMRVVQTDDEAFSILVMLGDFTPAFNAELEGRHVVATGIVKTEVRNMDALNEQHVHGEDCDHEDEAHAEGEDHECASTEEAVARLKEKGIDPDISVYVELTAYELK